MSPLRPAKPDGRKEENMFRKVNRLWIVVVVIIALILVLGFLPATCDDQAEASGNLEADNVGFLNIVDLTVEPTEVCTGDPVTATVGLLAQWGEPTTWATTLTVSYPDGLFVEVFPAGTVSATRSINFMTPSVPTDTMVVAQTARWDGLGDRVSRPLYVVECPPPGPYGTLGVSVTGSLTIKAMGIYTGSVDWGSCLTWGDGSSVCFPGFAGSFCEPHTYSQAGLYTATLVVRGTSYTYTTWVQVDFRPPPIPSPTGTLDVETTGFLSVQAIGSYSNSLDWGACLYWGDGQSVCFPGAAGSFKELHTYSQAGLYTVTLTVVGQEETYTASVVVDFRPPAVYRAFLPIIWKAPPPPPPPPGCTITNVVGPTPYDYTTTLSWSGANADWWLFFWGDESQTGAQPVGFWGPEGSQTWEHVYNPGVYSQTAPLQGPGGEGGCHQVVTVP
jgi:hypothetical protein